MADMQSQINQLLDKLKRDLEKITRLRTQAGRFEQELVEVQHDYDQKLGPLNAAADQLEGRKQLLRARLAQKESPPPAPTVVASTPPPEVIEPGPKPPPPPPKDPRAARKRALADHVACFIAGEVMETVMQEVNAILEDKGRDVGDMLEIIPWGDIWTDRSNWETLAMQHDRLQGWDQSLSVRLAYWQGQRRRLEDDPRRGLLRERQSRSRPAWLAYLDELAHKQATANEKLGAEVEFLEQQLAGHSAQEASHE